MDETEIIKFLKNNIEPIEDKFHGAFYRASVYLKDETFLPCVVFRNSQKTVDLAIKRFKEEKQAESIFSRKHGFGYKQVVKSFGASGNRLNHFDISKITESRFALPKKIQYQITGETAISWKVFIAKFKDNRKLSFGTRWHDAFFEIPTDYNVNEIVEIINDSYIQKNGEIISHNSLKKLDFDLFEKIHQDKPFFECYLDNL